MKRYLNIFAAIVALCSFTGCYEEIDLVEDGTYTVINYTTNDNEVADIRTGYSGMHVISNTYTNGVGKVVVKGKMTVFYNYFENCDNVTSVTIPKGVTTIREYAFCDCDNLKSIVIPEGVKEIESYAFSDCDALASVTFPSTLVTIGSRAFSDCDNLKSIVIPDGVTEIKSNTFYNCDKLASVTLPKTLVTIGSYAFQDCDALGSIVIPDNVTTIESWAFEGCNALKSVTIGRSVTAIGYDAFWGCNNLKTIINRSNLKLTKGSSSYGYVAYYADKITEQQSNENNRSYVDLGLPSGVKWATYNIGATKPEELGNRYYWGETTTSLVNNTMYVNVGDDISGNAKYDAARAQWGGDWRMPKYDDFRELLNECDWYGETYNGVNGFRVYGPNGNDIFLPLSPYWSSTSYQGNEPNDAAIIFSYDTENNTIGFYYTYRNTMLPIRPVIN